MHENSWNNTSDKELKEKTLRKKGKEVKKKEQDNSSSNIVMQIIYTDYNIEKLLKSKIHLKSNTQTRKLQNWVVQVWRTAQ